MVLADGVGQDEAADRVGEGLAQSVHMIAV